MKKLIILVCLILVHCSQLEPSVEDAPDTTPDASDVSNAPEVVDMPDASDSSDVSDVSDAPEVMDMSDTSDVLDTPDVSDSSDVSDVSDTPEVMDMSDVSDSSDVSDVSDAPEVMDMSDASDVSDSQDTSDIIDTVDVQHNCPGNWIYFECVGGCAPPTHLNDGTDPFILNNCGGCGRVCPSGSIGCTGGICY